MNEKHIQDIINALYDMIQDARGVPLSSDKCIIERDKVLDMLDQIIDQMPGELKQARSIVESRAEIVAQAHPKRQMPIRLFSNRKKQTPISNGKGKSHVRDRRIFSEK